MPTVAWWASVLPAAKTAPTQAPAIKYRLPIMMHLLHVAAKR
jgi:hypothetical protein